MSNVNEEFPKKEGFEIIGIKAVKGFFSHFSIIAVLYSLIFFPWALYLLIFPQLSSGEFDYSAIFFFITNIVVVIMLWANTQQIADQTLKNKTFYRSLALMVFVGFLFGYSMSDSISYGIFFILEFFIGLLPLWILNLKNLYIRTTILLAILLGLAYCGWALVHYGTEVYFINKLDW